MALVYACVYCKQNLLHISTFCKRSLWLIPGNISQGHPLYSCVGTTELAAQWYLIQVDTHLHVVIHFFSQSSLQLWSGCFICWTSVEDTDSFPHLPLSWLSNPNTLLSFFPLPDCCSKIVCWQTFYRTFLLNTSSFQTSWSNEQSCKDSELLDFSAFVDHACASRVDFIFPFVEYACFKDSPLLIRLLLLTGHCSFLWVESERKAQDHNFTFCDFDLS